MPVVNVLGGWDVCEGEWVAGWVGMSGFVTGGGIGECVGWGVLDKCRTCDSVDVWMCERLHGW